MLNLSLRKTIRARWFALALLLAPSLLFAADKLKNADCLDCHTDPANKRVVNGHAVAMALFPTNGFAKSVHSSLDCVDCHDGIKEMQHDKNVPPPNCTGCHDKEGKDYATSIHGMSHSMGASGAAQPSSITLTETASGRAAGHPCGTSGVGIVSSVRPSHTG